MLSVLFEFFETSTEIILEKIFFARQTRLYWLPEVRHLVRVSELDYLDKE